MSLLEDAKRRAAELGIEPPAEQPRLTTEVSPADGQFDPDLIPSTADNRSAEGGLDEVIDAIDILDAYRRWCGKMEPDARGRREGIMVSCPSPWHPDSHPSAWINLDKQVWHCGACQEGGDKYDIAAWHFGHPVPGYKATAFPELRRQMAEELGYTVRLSLGGSVVLTGPPAATDVPDSDPVPDTDPLVDADPVAGTDAVADQEPVDDGEPVGNAVPASDVEPRVLTAVTPLPLTLIAPGAPAAGWPGIDWRSVVPADTFLHEWMKACAQDDLPEEYYLWLGLAALSLAIGDDVVLRDTVDVKGNLFICLLGPTGMGKSRSIGALERFLPEALPYDWEDPNSRGACLIPNPGSAEALVDSFSRPIMDPVDPAKIVDYGVVRGLLKIPELSDLMASGQRAGNKLKPKLMDLYDAPRDITLVSRGSGLAVAKRPYCSVVTSTQVGAIKDLIAQGDAASGFANRWVFVPGRPKKLVAIGRSALDLTGAVAPLQAVHGWASTGQVVHLTDESADRWTAFFDKHIAPMKLSEEHALMQRNDLVLKKLILLFAANERVTSPSVELVDRVTSLHAYMLESGGIVKDQIGSNYFNECMDAVLRAVRGRPGPKGPSLRDIERAVPKRFGRDLLKRVIQTLIELDMLHEELPAPGARGRPATRYRYNA